MRPCPRFPPPDAFAPKGKALKARLQNPKPKRVCRDLNLCARLSVIRGISASPPNRVFGVEIYLNRRIFSYFRVCRGENRKLGGVGGQSDAAFFCGFADIAQRLEYFASAREEIRRQIQPLQGEKGKNVGRKPIMGNAVLRAKFYNFCGDGGIVQTYVFELFNGCVARQRFKMLRGNGFVRRAFFFERQTNAAQA